MCCRQVFFPIKICHVRAAKIVEFDTYCQRVMMISEFPLWCSHWKKIPASGVHLASAMSTLSPSLFHTDQRVSIQVFTTLTVIYTEEDAPVASQPLKCQLNCCFSIFNLNMMCCQRGFRRKFWLIKIYVWVLETGWKQKLGNTASNEIINTNSHWKHMRIIQTAMFYLGLFPLSLKQISHKWHMWYGLYHVWCFIQWQNVLKYLFEVHWRVSLLAALFFDSITTEMLYFLLYCIYLSAD